MRSLSAGLLAAQKASKRKPYLSLSFTDTIANTRRFRWASQYTGAEAAGPHAAIVGSDYSLNRFRVEAGTLYRQRVASPVPGSNFSSWTSLATARGALAVTRYGANIEVFAVRTDGGTPNREVWLYKSTDDGVSWAAGALQFTAPAAVTYLAVGSKSDGDLAVFFDYGVLVRRIKRTSAVWGSQVDWTNVVTSITGLACVYSADWNLVVTGTEAVTLEPRVWTCIFGDGYSQAVDTWSALWSYMGAAVGSGVSYSRPFLASMSSYRLTYREVYAGTGAYDRVVTAVLGGYADFVTVRWADPEPVDLAATYGLALAGISGQRGWCSTPSRVFCSQLYAVTDVSSRLVALDVVDEAWRVDAGWVELDNHDGALNEANLGGTGLEGLRLGSEMWLLPGYYKADGAAGYVVWPHYYVRGLEWRLSGNRSVLRVLLGSNFWLLAKASARTREWVAGTAAVYQIYADLVGAVRLGAGCLSNSPAFVNMYPGFAVRAGEGLLGALREVFSLVEDEPLSDTQEIYGVWPQVGDATDYAYGTDHAIVGGRHAVAAQATVARALGVAADGSPIFGESIDWAAAGDFVWPEVRFRRAAGTASEAATLAGAMGREADFGRYGGELVIGPNVGQEVWDVIEITDARLGYSAAKRRVLAVRLLYDRARGLFEMRLGLGGL
jgi:hypothetical protein